MSESRVFTKSRRRFWIYTTLIFFAGVIVGLLFGVFGLRYLFFRFPPSRDEMVAKVAGRIGRDFNLDDTAAKALEDECRRMFAESKVMLDETRSRLEAHLDEHVRNIAGIFPDEESRQRWLKEYRNYFPKGPPRPPPGLFPPPPPPPRG